MQAIPGAGCGQPSLHPPVCDTLVSYIKYLHFLVSQVVLGQPSQHEFLGNSRCKFDRALTTLRTNFSDAGCRALIPRRQSRCISVI